MTLTVLLKNKPNFIALLLMLPITSAPAQDTTDLLDRDTLTRTSASPGITVHPPL